MAKREANGRDQIMTKCNSVTKHSIMTKYPIMTMLFYDKNATDLNLLVTKRPWYRGLKTKPNQLGLKKFLG